MDMFRVASYLPGLRGAGP